MSARFSIRSPITVTLRGKKYSGEYEIQGSILRVFFKGKSTERRIWGSDPEFFARLLLIELVQRSKIKSTVPGAIDKKK